MLNEAIHQIEMNVYNTLMSSMWNSCMLIFGFCRIILTLHDRHNVLNNFTGISWKHFFGDKFLFELAWLCIYIH